MSRNLKQKLEEKFTGTTTDSIDEIDLPQINKEDLKWAVAGVPLAFVFIIIAVILSVGVGFGVCALLGYIGYTLSVFPIVGGIVKLIMLGAIFMIWISLKSIILAFFNNDILEISFVLPENDDQIKKDITEVCSKLNIPIPENILLSFKPTFYVTEAPIINFNGKYKGRTLVIGIAFLRYLNNNEFKSIISHEMGHFTGRDTTFSLYCAPLYKSLGRIINTLENHSDPIEYIPMLPLIYQLKIFYNWYAKLEAKISRQREMRADYIATLLYGEQNFRSALTKVANFSTIFSDLYAKHYMTVLRENKVFKNYFSFFDSILNIKVLSDEDFIKDDSSDFSSHCSTRDRFAYLPKINNSKKSIAYKYEQYSQIEEELTAEMGIHIMNIIKISSRNQKQRNQTNSPLGYRGISKTPYEKTFLTTSRLKRPTKSSPRKNWSRRWWITWKKNAQVASMIHKKPLSICT